MPNRILPTLFVLLKVRKSGGDVSVNLAQSRPFLSAMLYSHGDQSDITVRWLFAGRIIVSISISSYCRRRGTVRYCCRGGRCRWCRWITVGGAVKGPGRWWPLLIEMMMSGACGVHGNRRIRAVQAVMRVMMTQRRMVRCQTSGEVHGGVQLLRCDTDAAILHLWYEAAHWKYGKHDL